MNLLQWSEGNHSDGTRGKHDKTWQMDLQERCNVTAAFLDTVHLWTLEKLDLVSDHVITWLKTLFSLKHNLLQSVSSKTMSFVLVRKMYWNLLSVFVDFFALNRFEDAESKTVIVRLSVERVYSRAQLPTFRHFPASASALSSDWETAWGDTPLHKAARLGQVEAAEFLLSKGAVVDATDKVGPGPQRQGQKSRLQLGAPQQGFWNWNSEKMFAVLAGLFCRWSTNRRWSTFKNAAKHW